MTRASSLAVRDHQVIHPVRTGCSEVVNVTRILLTAMSGSGKSTMIDALAQRGHRAVDLDGPEWSEYRSLGTDEVPPAIEPGPDWVWRDEEIAALLPSTGDVPLFVAGCAPNQGRFRSEFDHVVLLTAPVQVTLERLGTRKTNPFGKNPDERAKILADKADVEPMLRAGADLIVERPNRSRRPCSACSISSRLSQRHNCLCHPEAAARPQRLRGRSGRCPLAR